MLFKKMSQIQNITKTIQQGMVKIVAIPKLATTNYKHKTVTIWHGNRTSIQLCQRYTAKHHEVRIKPG